MGPSKSFQSILDKHRPDMKTYESIYRDFHQNPELSTLENETSAKIVKHLKSISQDLDIRTGIGGNGLIAIYKNGSGPTILLRSDMDGLPIEEETGLEYASKKRMTDATDNVEKPVMHACGHDAHMTCNIGAAETLLKAKDEWSGTIIFLFQPAEEIARGAQAMVEDGLFGSKHNCPIPDVLLGQHVFPLPPGKVVTKAGTVMSAADSFRITIYGKGGHGSMPDLCVDPVVVGSSIVMKLQTIVSREMPPSESAVVTVASFHSGATANVISNQAVLQLNVRTVSEHSRKVAVDAVYRIVKGECQMARCPKEPLFERLSQYPLSINDAGLSEKVQESFTNHFGDQHQVLEAPFAGSEDFSNLATAINKPSFFWGWSATHPDTWKKYEDGTLDQLPSNHSSSFTTGIPGALVTGIDAMVVAALTFVGKSP
ncbi:hypothetical protein ASPVEDRAFT_47662 [Aspergillus versicolor CBS 583.65]|uniref:Peptidase M20 dimerisation domain-containing protein n=1 Tax=Aspergillus versicolor CBS 583.65 TaxID=1036611 RepID=A0A1L9Q405_ASPVE|nr:uncharacterized protein ASPVEDRAFT_47662 [Aspergillus versicolor CBS 583.65]OJJ08513.1 hypothetical protein ASPVEDRAFT_47662 [Aspergillus versicolor CBS 583.65]